MNAQPLQWKLTVLPVCYEQVRKKVKLGIKCLRPDSCHTANNNQTKTKTDGLVKTKTKEELKA